MAFSITTWRIIVAVMLTAPSCTNAFQIHHGLTSSSIRTPSVRLLAAAAAVAETLPAGIVKTVTRPGDGPVLYVGDVATIRYSCHVVEDDGAVAALPFARSSSQTFVVGDGLMIDGWELALQSMRGGERSVVRLTDPKFAYGTEGFPPVVPESAVVELQLEVLDVEQGVDLGTIASADPLKPRTPASIAAAYSTRREQIAIEDADKKEGIEGMIEKFKTYYFFGFFEGETGQQAPWYLRPSITFPIAFAIVGAAFWVSYAGGAISSRGGQIKDELDEIIVSMNAVDGVAGQVLALTLVAASLGAGSGL